MFHPRSILAALGAGLRAPEGSPPSAKPKASHYPDPCSCNRRPPVSGQEPSLLSRPRPSRLCVPRSSEPELDNRELTTKYTKHTKEYKGPENDAITFNFGIRTEADDEAEPRAGGPQTIEHSGAAPVGELARARHLDNDLVELHFGCLRQGPPRGTIAQRGGTIQRALPLGE